VDSGSSVSFGHLDGMARVIQSFGVIQPPGAGELDLPRESFADQGSSIAGGTFNLANTIMGAALTGLPGVMMASGVVPFVTFMTISGAAGLSTLLMLVDVCNYMQAGKKDFQAVGKQAFGPLGLAFTAIATCLSCCGALTAYFVLVGTTSPVLSKFVGFDIPPRVFQILIATVLVLPLCLLKDISGLAPSSLFAMLVFILMAVASLSKAFIGDTYYTGADAIAWFPDKLGLGEISRLPTIVMAFNCQYAMLPIYQNLRGRRQGDMNTVCMAGIGSAYIVYMVVAIGGYFCYKQFTMDMILNNFRHCKERGKNELVCEDENVFFKILTALFLLAVLLGYPCVHFAMRKAQLALILGTDYSFQWPLHAGLAVVNILLTLSVALMVGDKVGEVFQWTGAVASPLISFILPSWFSVKIWWQAGQRGPKLILGSVMLLYGCTVMCLGVTCNLLNIFSGSKK